MRLMRDVAALRTNLVSDPCPSLWIYPAGYFGFDALRFAQLRSEKADPAPAWPALPADNLDNIQQLLVEKILPLYGARATLVVGVDDGARQLAWVGQTDADGQMKSHSIIVRGNTAVSARSFSAGKLRAAAFVCGEFTGCATESNGPFYDDGGQRQYLCEPTQQLADVKLVIDLAHSHVPGTVKAAVAHQRYPHQRQMERLANAGIASVLTHHHADEQVQGRPANRHQSSWLLFADGTWADESSVHQLA